MNNWARQDEKKIDEKDSGKSSIEKDSSKGSSKRSTGGSCAKFGDEYQTERVAREDKRIHTL